MTLIVAAAAAGIEFVLMHEEPSAIFAAAGEAEVCGRPAVCIATLGPGLANSVNGLAHCLLDRVPLLLITDTPGPSGYLHQRLSHAEVVRGVVKSRQELMPNNAVAAVREALAESLCTPRGPVHLDLGTDVAKAESQSTAAEGLATAAASELNMVAVSEAAALLARSRRPVVLAGIGATFRGAAAGVRELVARIRSPVLTTYKAKGVLPETDPLSAGLLTNGAAEAVLLDRADLLIAIGLDEVELMPGPWRWKRPTITVGPGPRAESHLASTVNLDANVAEATAALLRRVHYKWRSEWETLPPPSARPATSEVTRTGAPGVPPTELVAIARRVAPLRTIATVDAGSHMFAATLFWNAPEPARFLISNGLSTMGFGLPAAIGAALSDSGPVVCFTGDGGLAMAVGELETLARLRLPVTVVVFNDSTLNLIKIKQEKRGEATLGLDFGAIDWVAVAAGMGVAGERITDVAALERAFGAAFAAGGPRLLDVTIDASSYPAMLEAIRG